MLLVFIDVDLLKDLEKDSFSEEEIKIISRYDKIHTICLIFACMLVFISFLGSNLIEGGLGYIWTIIINVGIICLCIYMWSILWFLKRKLSKISDNDTTNKEV